MESGAGGEWKVLSTSHGNNAAKIGFVMVLKVFYIKFHQVHALTPARYPIKVKTSKLGCISSLCCGFFSLKL